MKFLLPYIIIFISISPLKSQIFKNSTVFSFKNITSKHGLPSNTVYHITQDLKGNIWFATDKGISMYDGVRFKNWSIKEGLVDLDILYLNEDSKGRIWASTSGGGLLYIKNEKIFNVYNSRNISRLKLSSWITTSIEDKEGNLWFSSFLKETVKINKDLQTTFFFYPHTNNNHPKYPDGRLISDFYLNNESNPELIFSGHGPTSFDPKSNKTTSKSPGIFFKADRVLRVNHNEYIFSRLNKIFIMINKKIIDSIDLGIKMRRIVKIMNNDENSFFISDGKSIYEIHHSKYKIKFSKKLIEEDGVDKVFIDKENNLWINSIHKGVYVLYDTLVRHIDHKTLKNTKIYSLELFNGKLYAGSDNGKLFITSEKKTTEDSSISKLVLDGRGRINQIEKVDDQQLFISQENYLCLLKNNKLYILPLASKNISIFKSSIGVGFSNNCYLIPRKIALNPGSLEFNHQTINSFSILPGYRTHKITGVDYNNIYIATSEGLFNFDIEKQTSYQLDKEKELRYPIRFMEQISKNKLFVGIDGVGIYYIENNIIKNRYSFENPESLIINRLKKINNRLYLCTNRGITIFGIHEFGINKINSLDNSDGISSNSINDIILTKNEYILATDSGVTILDLKYFEPSKTNEREKPATLYEILPKESSYIKDNVIFVKAGLNVSLALNTHKNRNFGSTKVRVRNFKNQNWEEQNGIFATIKSQRKDNNQTFIQYKLKHGNWIDLNSLVIVKDDPSDLEKFVFDRKNQKIGYYISFCIFFLILSTIFYIILTNKVLLKQRIQIIKSEIKPHMLMNSLSSLQYFYTHGDFESGNQQIQNYKDFLSSFIKSSDMDFINLTDELTTIRKYLRAETLKNNRNISFSIDIYNIQENDDVYIPSMIIQPIVENSIKHAFTDEMKDRKISISIMAFKKDYEKTDEAHYIPSLIVMEISDNGKGFLEDEIGTGLGTRSVIEKIALLNKKHNMNMSIKYSKPLNGNGTLVRLKIPVGENTKKLGTN